MPRRVAFRVLGPVFWTTFFFVLCLSVAPAPPAMAEPPITLPAALERVGAPRPEQRAELQRELERHSEVIEAQSAVVRIVAKLIGPAVAYVEADVAPEDSMQVGRGRQIEEAGSGVIIEHKGAFYVLTNRHVIRNAQPQAVRISLADGRRLNPTKVWRDDESDVAVLAVSAPDLVAASIGDSNHTDIGDFVLAVGSPFGLNRSVTYGIISAKGRHDLPLSEKLLLQDFLQTDAAINPGNSGGPLVNLHGEVIGINTAIASKSGGNYGIGFAIPINMFMVFARQLIETGKVIHPFLGVNLNPSFGPATAAELGLPRPIGAHVKGITPKSPAELANLQRGDVILEFDNKPVENDVQLVNLVGLAQVGKRVPLLVFRDRKPIEVMVEVVERDKSAK